MTIETGRYCRYCTDDAGVAALARAANVPV